METLAAQIEAAASHHAAEMQQLKASREAALRPVVKVVHAVRDGAMLTLTCGNFGPGPALDLTVDVWFEETEANIPAVYDAWKRLRAQAPPTTQTVIVAFGIIGAGQRDETLMPVPRAALGLVLSPAVFRLNYEDAFGNEFEETVDSTIRNESSVRESGR